METNNTFFQIQTFPRYEINRQGVIREARTRQEIQPIAGKPYTYLLYNKAGERRQIGLKSIYRQVFNAEYCQDSTQDITGEEWLPIAGTKGKYFISNKGRVKSFVAKVLNGLHIATLVKKILG